MYARDLQSDASPPHASTPSTEENIEVLSEQRKQAQGAERHVSTLASFLLGFAPRESPRSSWAVSSAVLPDFPAWEWAGCETFSIIHAQQSSLLNAS